MRHLSLFALVLTVGVCSAATVEDVLQKLDQAAPKFTGMTADLSRTTYTKVLDEKTVETGTMSLRKNPKDIQVLITLVKPDEKIVSFRGRKAEVYFPKLKTVQEWDLGKHGNLIDQFLLVGFGSGRDLRASYGIKYAGEESVGGQKTHHLELTPTAANVKDKLRRVDLWIADSGAYPVQQRFVQPSGDYYLVTYTDVKLNPALTEEALKLKLPKGVKREHPQK
jgi:outer membrane lipoprotein-sorting protein